MTKYKVEGFEVGAEVVVTPNPSNRRKPRVYSTQEWSILEEIITGAVNRDEATRSYQRLVIGHAVETTVDKNGYVDLPEEFFIDVENA